MTVSSASEEDWNPLRSSGPPPWVRAMAGDGAATARGDRRLAEAERLFTEGRVDEAAALLDAILAETPNDGAALYALGLLRHTGGDDLAAADLLARARAAEPGHPGIPYLAAVVWLRLGRLDTARAMLRQARALAADDPRILELDGEVAMIAGDPAGAVEAFGRAAAVQPGAAAPMVRHVLALAAARRLDEAARHVAIAAPKFGQTTAWGLVNADVLAMTGALAAAGEAYRRVAGLPEASAAETAQALCGAAEQAARRGLRGDAARLVRAALAQVPERPRDQAGVWRAVARVAEQAGDVQGGLAACRRAIALDPGDGGARWLAGRLLGQAGAWDEATRCLEDALARAPGDEATLGDLGQTLIAAGRLDEAAAFHQGWAAQRPDQILAAWRAEILTGMASPAPPPVLVREALAERALDDPAARADEAAAARVVAAALAHLGPEPVAALDVLELGCGVGGLGAVLAPWARRLVGVDVSARRIEATRHAGHHHLALRADPLSFAAVRRHAYDLIVGNGILGWSLIALPVLADLAGALRTGGHLLLVVEEEEEEAGANEHAARRTPWGTVRHTADGVRAALDAAGFTVIASGAAPLAARPGLDRAAPSLLVVLARASA